MEEDKEMSCYKTAALCCTSPPFIHPEAVDTTDWTDAKVLRSITGVVDNEANQKILFDYAVSVEIIISNYPNFSRQSKIDWAIARAMSPEWFGDHLTDRINNSMLVSALLLTVTAAYFIVAPEYDVGDAGKDSTTLRVFFFMNAFATILFIISIVLGICFIENALSRAYNDADKFVLIIEQYGMRHISQMTSIVGAIIFNASLFVPQFGLHKRTDSIIISIIGAVLATYTLYNQITAMNLAAARQMYRMQKFRPLVDYNGRLLAKWYPKDAAITQQDVIDMYR